MHLQARGAKRWHLQAAQAEADAAREAEAEQRAELQREQARPRTRR